MMIIGVEFDVLDNEITFFVRLLSGQYKSRTVKWTTDTAVLASGVPEMTWEEFWKLWRTNKPVSA